MSYKGIDVTVAIDEDLVLERRDFEVTFIFRVEGEVLISEFAVVTVLFDLKCS